MKGREIREGDYPKGSLQKYLFRKDENGNRARNDYDEEPSEKKTSQNGLSQDDSAENPLIQLRCHFLIDSGCLE